VATSAKTGTDKPISQRLEEAKPEIKSLYESLRQAILDQGEDVSEKATKLSFAFKRTRNFASIVLRKNILLLYLDLNPDSVEMKQNMRDVRNIGHWGTGDLEVRIGTLEDIQQALPLIQKAYEGQA
jgi:predicted transport protein